ncbi:MAG: hypothetical protein KGD63_11060 [Candidatus Lokiarchaeota archaeon]|nr:hypothetical protein [Candidatus Lokiarchaeota archaeon]
MIEAIILISISIVLSIVGIFNLYYNQEKYVMEGLDFTLLFLYFIDEIVYFLFFNLSFETVISINMAIFFYKISILIRILKLILLGSIHSYILFQTKIRYLPAFIYCFLGGIIGVQLFILDAFDVSIIENHYFFILKDQLLYSLLLIFNILIIGFMIFTQIRCNSNITFGKMRKLFNMCVIHYILNIIVYIFYFFYPNYNLRYLYSIFFLSFLIFTNYLNIKNFEFFIVVTNKIFDFSVFHRSGVLLYSYNFEKGEEIEDSMLKGSILIGINHILANFIDKKEKLDLIKMQDRDITFEFNSELGYGILLIARNNNKIIIKAVKLFMNKFTLEFRDLLTRINKERKIFDTSEFSNTKNIMEEYFWSFLQKE